MRIIGPNFSVNLTVRDGTVTMASRSIRYMEGWPLARVLALAQHWNWRVELDDYARAVGERPSGAAQRPTT